MKSILFRGINRRLMVWGIACVVGCPMGSCLAAGPQVGTGSVAADSQQEKNPASSGPQEFEKLKWLVGKWTTGSGAAIPAEASAKWSPDGKFLILDYSVSPPGFPVISASDRIAWDPSGKTFRSWTFRGDGGFGQANWVEREQGWMIRYGGTHSDGRQFSSTLLLQGADGKLQLSAIERWVGEEQFPDLVLELEHERSQPAPLVSIENKTWELTRMESGPCRAKNLPTLSLTNQEVQAFGGINQIGGQYQKQGESLRFRNLVSTLMGGSEAASEVEHEFSSMLERVTRYTLEDEQLVLWAGEKKVAWFNERKSEPASFEQVRNVTWELVELKGMAVQSDLPPTLRFADGTLEGFGGVNQMNGTFNQTEATLSFGPLRSTKRGGPQPAMQLETRFGQLLETVDGFEISQDQLLLLKDKDVVAKFRRQE
ncbi:MAG: META domain-containing protein [Pirellulaceae bacterium]|nr:META domain-containing protein [Pirellulaceae bacterium]